MLPNDFPPWERVYQRTQRWLPAGCFESMVSDLRSVIRVAQGRRGQPSAVILDGRTIQSTCESGPRAGYAGYKRKRGSKVHIAVDTLGQLLAVHVTPANEQERAQVAELARQVQQVTGRTVKVAFADQGYTGKEPAQAALDEGIELQVIKLEETKKGFVLFPAGGWSSAALAGSTVSGVSHVTMNGSPKLSAGFISSSSPCSCLSTPYQYFKVPNTLQGLPR
jgi:transposase